MSGVFQVNASLRSRHANAYFTGLGKTRRIALFDTLIEQHTHEEILAVMAHEIGHWKLRHLLKFIVAGILASGVGMALVALLLNSARIGLPVLARWCAIIKFTIVGAGLTYICSGLLFIGLKKISKGR